MAETEEEYNSKIDKLTEAINSLKLSLSLEIQQLTLEQKSMSLRFDQHCIDRKQITDELTEQVREAKKVAYEARENQKVFQSKLVVIIPVVATVLSTITAIIAVVKVFYGG